MHAHHVAGGDSARRTAQEGGRLATLVRRPQLSAPPQPVAEHEGQLATGRDPDRLIKLLPATDEYLVKQRAIDAEHHGGWTHLCLGQAAIAYAAASKCASASFATSQQTSGSAGCVSTQLGVVA
jgi:hypothetical protein